MSINNTACYIFTSSQHKTPPTLTGVDIAFVGVSVDDRGNATTSALKSAASKLSTLKFIASNQTTYLDGKVVNRAKLTSYITGKKRILLDTTTLGLGEILQVLLAINRANIASVEFLYAEPQEYTRTTTTNMVDRQLRDFSLTQNCTFCSMQGFAHEYQSNMRAAHVFFLGFEPARILNALEQRNDFNHDVYRCHVILGVPAFQAGWESNSIRPHLSVLDQMEIREHSITYCQANSIREAYMTLWDLYRQLGDERGCFFVSPLGTKPHAIGAALFLIETKGSDIPTSLYYDHPERVQKRSSEVATWHLVRVQLNSQN